MAHYGLAWLLLCLALAIHVLDEALTDYLAVQNPTVRAIRQRFPFLATADFLIPSLARWADPGHGPLALPYPIRLAGDQLDDAVILCVRGHHAREWAAAHTWLVVPEAPDARRLFRAAAVGWLDLSLGLHTGLWLPLRRGGLVGLPQEEESRTRRCISCIA
jgi:hypothetical protein